MSAASDPAAVSTVPVIRAGIADLDTLSQVISDAFFDLPQSRWLISDPVVRREIFPLYFRLHVAHALANGIVQTTTSRSAAALWLPSTAGQPVGYDVRLSAVTGPWAYRFRAFDATLDQHHPTGTRHHWLAMLAVRPTHQGQGIGSALLGAYHERPDAHGIPAYLEAATRRSIPLYQRHGYELRSNAPFYLPDGGPAFWPMWRQPKDQPQVSRS
jgi:GNAT superfamily N-acetyltransferase